MSTRQILPFYNRELLDEGSTKKADLLVGFSLGFSRVGEKAQRATLKNRPACGIPSRRESGQQRTTADNALPPKVPFRGCRKTQTRCILHECIFPQLWDGRHLIEATTNDRSSRRIERDETNKHH